MRIASVVGTRPQFIKEAALQPALRARPHEIFIDTGTLARPLASAKLELQVARPQAGLRSFERRTPEEINRVLVDNLSQRCFAPTASAASNFVYEWTSNVVRCSA